MRFCSNRVIKKKILLQNNNEYRRPLSRRTNPPKHAEAVNVNGKSYDGIAARRSSLWMVACCLCQLGFTGGHAVRLINVTVAFNVGHITLRCTFQPIARDGIESFVSRLCSVLVL